MNVQRIAVATLIAATFIAGCESTDPSFYQDDVVTEDLAASAGEAMAASIADMIGNESSASMPMIVGADPTTANAVTTTRSRTCYDGADAVLATCTPIASIRRIVTNLTVDGTRSDTRETKRGTQSSWTGTVHRVVADTMRRTFNTAQPPVEVSRTHSGFSTGNDTTTFTEGDFTRKAAESLRDTVKALRFDLPRSTNPWPAAGSLIRVTTVTATVSKGTLSETRNFTRRVEVTFPADAQGNVSLKINATTCNLNLVTRKVTNCQG